MTNETNVACAIRIECPSLRLVYRPIPRAGNTEVKLFLAGLLGYARSDFAESDWPHPTVAQGVHHGGLVDWTGKSRTQRTSVSRSKPSFDFTVVRHPIERFVSAWQILIADEDPHLWAIGMPVPDELRVTRDELQSRERVKEKFLTFLDSSYLQELTKTDVHFIPQTTLTDGRTQKTRVYQIESGLTSLLMDLSRHIGGTTSSDMPRENVSLRLLDRHDLDAETEEKIVEIYTEDFLNFDYQIAGPLLDQQRNRRLTDPPDYLRLYDEKRERNQRILSLWEALR